MDSSADLRALLERPVLDVAPLLLGAVLRHGGVACRLTEVEAYDGANDPGSHAYRGPTPRNDVMFGPAGHLYVYFTYGMHWCANAVTRRHGLPSAVLLRAAEPVDGVATMRRRRGGRCADRDLMSGPGRLCQALGISGPAHNGRSLAARGLRILEGSPVARTAIAVTPRIGVNVAADWPLRFLIRDSRCVSARAQTARFLAQSVPAS